MKYTIHIGTEPIILEHGEFDKVIDVDSLTQINTSNLFGEAVTASASANRIGLLLSEVGAIMATKKLEIKIFESKYRSRLRSQASKNKGSYVIRFDNEDVEVKLTEKALETCFYEDVEYITLSHAFIAAEKNFNSITALYWAAQDKARKLNSITSGTTPKEFVEGLVNGKINGFTIKKG